MIKLSAEESDNLAERAKVVSERLAALLKDLPTLDAPSSQMAMTAADEAYKQFMTTLAAFVKRSVQKSRN